MKETERLWKQTDDTRIELPFEQVDVFDTNLFGRILETFGQNPRQAQGYFRVLRQKVPEIRTSQRKYDGWLDSCDRGRPRLSGKQRHFSHRGSPRKLGYEKIDASCRVLFPNLHKTRFDNVHGHTGSSFPNDHLGRRKFGSLQTSA